MASALWGTAPQVPGKRGRAGRGPTLRSGFAPVARGVDVCRNDLPPKAGETLALGSRAAAGLIVCSGFQTGKTKARFQIPCSAAHAYGTRRRPAQRKPGTLETPPGACAHSTGAAFPPAGSFPFNLLSASRSGTLAGGPWAGTGQGWVPPSERHGWALCVPVTAARRAGDEGCPARWSAAGPAGSHLTMPCPLGSLRQPAGATAKQNQEHVLLGREARAPGISQGCSHPPGTFLPPQKVGTEGEASVERKGSGKKLVTEEAIFILCYSCVHFSDQLGGEN